MANKKCSCGNDLDYIGEMGAPGIGQVWQCFKCKKSYHVIKNRIVPFSDVSPEDVEINVWQVK
jgi:hypothetical protein